MKKPDFSIQLSNYMYAKNKLEEFYEKHKGVFEKMKRLETDMNDAKDKLKIAMIFNAKTRRYTSGTIYAERDGYRAVLTVRQKRYISPAALLAIKGIQAHLNDVFTVRKGDLDTLIDKGVIDASVRNLYEELTPEYAISFEVIR